MSQAAVEQILGKLMLDREFRTLLRENPQGALAGYELTTEEREGFATLDLADFDQAAAALEDRVSKGGLYN